MIFEGLVLGVSLFRYAQLRLLNAVYSHVFHLVSHLAETFLGFESNFDKVRQRIGGGRLRIGFQGADGTEIPGFTLDDGDLQYGDEHARIVSWQGRSDVSALRGRAVKMTVELKDADLFSFVFESADGDLLGLNFASL